MKNKIWMTVIALLGLGVGLLTGGCAAPQSSQKSELGPLVGGAGAYQNPGERKSDWAHPTVMP